jgi:intracellular sulfur oxidation DsrE/DsrF family protein
MKHDISDEQLNAFVDGELDAADRERILAAVAADGELAQRACALRLVKEQVRHAYADSPAARSRHDSARPWRLLAGVLLLIGAAALGWMARDSLITSQATEARRGETAHLLLHLADWDAGRADAALSDAEGLLRAARDSGRTIEVELVANRGGLRLLRSDLSPHVQRIERMRAEHPNFALIACGQTVERLRAGGVEVHLLPGTRIASSALDQIVSRMSQGWNYVRI